MLLNASRHVKLDFSILVRLRLAIFSMRLLSTPTCASLICILLQSAACVVSSQRYHTFFKPKHLKVDVIFALSAASSFVESVASLRNQLHLHCYWWQ